jgi:hypothetical protein
VNRPVDAAFVTARKKCVFSIQCYRAHRSLNTVGVQLEMAVVEELGQPSPMAQSVADDAGGRQPTGTSVRRSISQTCRASTKGLVLA